jgi:isopenicillin N synthase-like dioxygenase
MEAYMAELTALSRRLLHLYLFALALDLPASTFDRSFEKPMYVSFPPSFAVFLPFLLLLGLSPFSLHSYESFRYFLRPLKYGAVVSDPSEGVFGCGAHSDYGMLTILATDSVPGLQVYQLSFLYFIFIPF